MQYLITTLHAFDGGIAEVEGSGAKHTLSFTGAWVEGDTVLLVAADAQTALTYQVGAGYASGKQPTFAYTYKGKVYVLAGSTLLYSAISAPSTFNDINASGNNYVNLSDFFSSPTEVVAMTVFQGRLAFFSRDTLQTFTIDADPLLWQQHQVFQNIGTVAKDSVQSIGDLDVLFLYDTGFRSLRVRDSSLNAFVSDLGAPIDAFVQAALAGYDASGAFAVVEPTSNRYWCFLKDKFYVFSYFLTGQIAAWSTYSPTYASGGVQTTFTPTAAVAHNGKVYCRDATGIYAYGGSDGVTYDNAVASLETPWLDAGLPGVVKQSSALSAGFEGAWRYWATMDYNEASTTKESVANESNDAFTEAGRRPFEAQGTHLRLRAETTGSTAAVFSEFVWRYRGLEEK